MRDPLILARVVARRYTIRGMEASDVRQEAICTALSAVDAYNPSEHGDDRDGFIVNRVRSHLRNLIRRTKSTGDSVTAFVRSKDVSKLSYEDYEEGLWQRLVESREILPDETGEPIDPTAFEPIDIVSSNEIYERLPEWLSPQETAVIRMTYWDNETDETIAKTLRVSPRRVQSARATALRKISEKCPSNFNLRDN